MIQNEIVERGGRRWLIREAVSMDAAENAIAHARVTGSVGATNTHVDVTGVETMVASVVQINSDGSERQPYTKPY